MVVRRQHSISEWVLVTEESVGKYGVKLEIYITLSEDNGICTADINKAFKFPSKKTALKMLEILELANTNFCVSDFRVIEVPDVLRNEGRGTEELYDENTPRGRG